MAESNTAPHVHTRNEFTATPRNGNILYFIKCDANTLATRRWYVDPVLQWDFRIFARTVRALWFDLIDNDVCDLVVAIVYERMHGGLALHLRLLRMKCGIMLLIWPIIFQTFVCIWGRVRIATIAIRPYMLVGPEQQLLSTPHTTRKRIANMWRTRKKCIRTKKIIPFFVWAAHTFGFLTRSRRVRYTTETPTNPHERAVTFEERLAICFRCRRARKSFPNCLPCQ